MLPPRLFDTNEWFILISALSILTVAAFLPRRFPATLVVAIWAFNACFAVTADHILASATYDLYDVNDLGKFEYFDMITYVISYPPAAYLFTYTADVWCPKMMKLWAFIIAWALLTWGLEWLAHCMGVFTYKGWELWWSGPTYVLIYWVNYTYFQWVKKQIAPRILV